MNILEKEEMNEVFGGAGNSRSNDLPCTCLCHCIVYGDHINTRGSSQAGGLSFYKTDGGVSIHTTYTVFDS